MNRSENISEIAKALVQAQKEMGSATKDAKNPFFKSSYADLNAIREATIPVLNEQKISVLQPTVMVDGKAFVETMLLHESGQYISSLTEIIAAKVNDAQSHGSGISYARRYGLQSLVCVGAEDDDGEGAVGRPKGKPSYTPPEKKEVVPVKTVTNTTTGETTKIMSDGTQQGSEAPKKGFGVKKEAPKVESSDGWS